MKQQEQDEAGLSLDDAEERAVVERQQRRRAAQGRYATARAGHGHLSAHGGPATMSVHGAHYSARVVVRPMSPTKATRLAAATARREEEQRTRRENDRQRREQARKAAMRAAARQAEEEERRKAQRQERLEAMRAAHDFGEQRERVAAQHRETSKVPAIGSLHLASAPPPTEKQKRSRKLKQRPEWGEGHAGGGRIGGAGAAAQWRPTSSQGSRSEEGSSSQHQPELSGTFRKSEGPASAEPAAGPAAPLLQMGGLGLAMPEITKLALPQREGEQRTGFQNHIEWKHERVPKPRAVQAAGSAGGNHREAWRSSPQPGVAADDGLPNGRLGSGMLSWLVNAATGSLGEDGTDVRASADESEWAEQLRTASAKQLCSLMAEVGTSDGTRAFECMCAARARMLEKKGNGRRRSFDESAICRLVDAGFAPTVVAAMRALPDHEPVQFTGCEVLSLLASNYWGLEQKVFGAGALEVCLAAVEAWQGERLMGEEVLGAAFQAVHNVCVAEDVGDKAGCARKQAAVDLGALELISSTMQHAREAWVQHAGKMAIGCLCKGVDKDGHSRRQRAHALFRLMR